ncbi:hypothetical protein [Spartinivicinus poritis]|uniref:NADH dehydrogenase subunit 3 n=1 Tax=Spartinivicinus poritis TaxID=2994640 RepID=A0ABT5UFU9_9GAMM|nr:hypothetical protein [Spartinivicinus sp. A2-2]MDE1464338.1 hypothetical protein [Spartinivicinus sp. A2-2]
MEFYINFFIVLTAFFISVVVPSLGLLTYAGYKRNKYYQDYTSKTTL